MGKKPPNSAKPINFGRIEVDPAIADKLDRATKIEEALRINKGFRTARTQNKRGRETKNRKAILENQILKAAPSIGVLAIKKLVPEELKEWQSELPSNHNRRDQGYNGWSKDWNREAHTGVVGKPPKRRDRTDPIYSKYPFAPRLQR